eukprot:UN21547
MFSILTIKPHIRTKGNIVIGIIIAAFSASGAITPINIPWADVTNVPTTKHKKIRKDLYPNQAYISR